MTAFLLPTLLLLAAADSARGQTQVIVEAAPVQTPVAPEPEPLSAPTPRPSAPYRVPDQCPFEFGCSFGLWQACEALDVMRAPAADAKRAFRFDTLQKFRALRADMVVTRIGRARVEYAMEDPSSRWGPAFPIGTEIDLLDYKGESAYGIWAEGRLWTMESAWARDPSPRVPMRLLEPPQMTWWVEVEALDGRRGWLGLRNTVGDMDDGNQGIGFDEVIHMDDWPTLEGENPDCETLLRRHRWGGSH